MEMLRLPDYVVSFGADPELFFTKGGQAFGSEKVINESLGASKPSSEYASPYLNGTFGRIVQDGVQVELNPQATSSMKDFGLYLRNALVRLRDQSRKVEGVSVSFCPLYEVTREELDSLSMKSRMLGCQPSNNLYGVKPLGIDPETYPIRAAGGHIHIGMSNGYNMIYKPGSINPEDHRWRLVALLDAIVGNTCVLIDRDPAQKVRRQVYGRAGEHRLPSHGLEYRTLSNFWLKDWSLTELVLDLTKIAVRALETTLAQKGDLEGELMNPVDIEVMQKAINENDSTLARPLFGAVVDFLNKYLPPTENPFDYKIMPKVEKFFADCEKRGLDAIFVDPISNWSASDCQLGAWRKFIEQY